ncbi:hypothetical protein L1987_20952 [Smallanthus sonchifolius]|uniref:Uncharacterized protein n=1 Tax=Smallanthus sonchifolius TaxID=185202 RepID=A0ACB9IUQ3_9ASTR|nr:hypothetical protein L1987_20952 [Smallanthus sonchifolius]
MMARFNYYPPCPWSDKVWGLKPHSDGSAMTLLLQDKEVEGLQILKDGQWFGVPIVPDALTSNVGDQIKDIGPVDELITDDTPRLYKNVTFSVKFYVENYQLGMRASEACKI